MDVFIADKIPEEALQILKKSGLTFEMYQGEELIDKKTLMDKVSDVKYLITPLSTQVDKEVIDAAPELKLIANFGAGTNNIDLEYAAAKEIPVTNTPYVSAVSTAEVTVALILALKHRVVEGDSLMRTTGFNGWAPLFFLGHQLAGKTVGIIGLGQIGREVARRLHAFDMQILYTQRKQSQVDVETELGAKYVSKDELLKSADIVTLHIPATKDTFHYLGEREFKLMKNSAVLVNAARGQVIDEKLLPEMLAEKEIAGAALDVYEKEPAVSDELKHLSNVILTPHVGNATVEARDAMAQIVAQNVSLVAQGQSAKYIVNAVKK